MLCLHLLRLLGTDSLVPALANALEELGIGPIYHMREVGKNGHQGLWMDALDSKFESSGKPLGREQFDQILAGYEAGLFTAVSLYTLPSPPSLGHPVGHGDILTRTRA
jgi:hypothetical protein